MKDLIIAVLATALIMMIFYIFMSRGNPPAPFTVEETTDTIAQVDTIAAALPTPTETKAAGTRHVTLPIRQPKKESQSGRIAADQFADINEMVEDEDTDEPPNFVEVDIPIEQHHYQGENYDAWVSGYETALDSIKVYVPTKTITRTITQTIPTKQKRWGISAGIGAVATTSRIEPGVFIGLTYTFVSF